MGGDATAGGGGRLIPFSREQFFAAFGDYNAAVWPAQVLLYLLAVAAVALAVLAPRSGHRGALAILGMLWLWAGAVYHLSFFAPINPAARIFGGLFVLQGGLFLWAGISGRRLAPGARLGWPLWVGAGLAVYALIGYPLLGLAVGDQPQRLPVLGVPCPTTILTIAVLFLCSSRWPRFLLVIPLAWSAIGGTATIALGVPQDFGMLLAGLATVFLYRRLPHPGAPDAVYGSRPGPVLKPRYRRASPPPPSRPSPALPRR